MNPIDNFRLSGRVALVSGGGGAIGSALGEAMAAAGAKIVLADIDRDHVDEAAVRVRAAGAECVAIAANVTAEADAEHVVRTALDQYGRLDIIVNAVGGGAGKALFAAHEYPRDAWDSIMELNLRSTVVATQAAVRAMIKGGDGGRIINISSVRALLGINAGYSAYVAAKGAVTALTRQWATEWAKYGITVNAIAPTFVDTPQVAMLLADEKFRTDLVSRVPLGRVGRTDDLVGPVIFFASPASSFVTGQMLMVDGGLTATQ